MKRDQMTLLNVTREVVLGAGVRRAADPWTRMVGLLGRASLGDGEGLWITPCPAVHTFLMRFPIDVLFLDRDGHVIRLAADLRPYRWAWGGRHAHTALELPAGTIAATGTRIGDRLTLR